MEILNALFLDWIENCKKISFEKIFDSNCKNGMYFWHIGKFRESGT